MLVFYLSYTTHPADPILIEHHDLRSLASRNGNSGSRMIREVDRNEEKEEDVRWADLAAKRSQSGRGPSAVVATPSRHVYSMETARYSGARLMSDELPP